MQVGRKDGIKKLCLKSFHFQMQSLQHMMGVRRRVAWKASWLCFSIKSSISIMYCLNRNSLALGKNHLQLVTYAEADMERTASESCLGPGSLTKGKPEWCPLQLHSPRTEDPWDTPDWSMETTHSVASSVCAPVPLHSKLSGSMHAWLARDKQKSPSWFPPAVPPLSDLKWL